MTDGPRPRHVLRIVFPPFLVHRSGGNTHAPMRTRDWEAGTTQAKSSMATREANDETAMVSTVQPSLFFRADVVSTSNACRAARAPSFQSVTP